jgi:hypothetical protein
MDPLIMFPDAELVMCDWLRSALLARGYNVPVATAVPATRPPSFVRLMRTGGARHTLVSDAAQITVECFAVKESAAANLAAICRALIHSTPGQVPAVMVYRVEELGGPQNLPDPSTTQYRYTQTFEVHLRGTAA